MTQQNLEYVGRFNSRGITKFAELLNSPLHEILSGIDNLITLLQQENFNQDRFDRFIRYTKILDQSRGESIINVVPELAKYFNE